MDSIPSTIPTASQMLELASRLPLEKPSLPSEKHIMLQFVDVCRTKWIRDFLFSREPLHVQHFNSAAVANSSFIAHHSCTLVEAVRPFPAGPLFGESRHTEGVLLFSPSFTAGHTTVGFGIEHAFMTLGAPWLPEGRISLPMRFNCRFVTDMSRGLLFTMHYAPNQDVLLMHCLRHQQTTCLLRFNAMLRRQQLLDSLDQDNGCLSTETLLKSLHFLTHDVQYRPCFVCGSPPSAVCGCLLPIHDPEHPFDMHYFSSGMVQFFGDLESILSKVVGANEMEKQHLVLASRTSVDGISAPLIAEKLKAWTLAEYARSLKEHPWKSPSPIALHGGTARNLYRKERCASDHFFWIAEIHDCHVATVATTPAQSLPFPNVKIPWSSAVATTNRLNSAVQKGRLHSEELNGIDNLGTATDLQLYQQMGQIQYENKITNEDHHLNPTTSIAQMGNISKLQTMTTSITTEELELAATTGSGVTLLGPVQRSRFQSECGELSITTELQEEIRKERNRASARKCNMRNKMLREGLKLELGKCHEKVAQLRAKEMELRRENVRLRSLLLEFDK